METTFDHVATMRAIEHALRQFKIAAVEVPEADVQRAAETVETASAVGWVIDPTQYRQRLVDKGLDRQRRLVKLFAHVQSELRAIYPLDAAVEDILHGAAVS